MAEGLFLGRGDAGDAAARLALFAGALMPADYVTIVGRGDGDFGGSVAWVRLGWVIIHGDGSLSSRSSRSCVWRSRRGEVWIPGGHRRSGQGGGRRDRGNPCVGSQGGLKKTQQVR